MRAIHSQPKALIFDCDGTLLDSMGMWLTVQPALLATYGIQTGPADFAEFEHLSVEEECAAYHRKWGIGASGEDVYARLCEMLSAEYAAHVRPREGAVTFLEAAQEAGIPMAVATSTPAEQVRIGLEANGMLRFMSNITTTGETGKTKEHPDVYDLALSRICADAGAGSIDPRDVWVFEDAVFGLISSGRAGYRRVGIFDPAGRGVREDVQRNADIFIDSYTELTLERICSFGA